MREVPRGWWIVLIGALLISCYAFGYVVLGGMITRLGFGLLGAA